MINTPDSVIVLDEEQSKREETAKLRLSNLESEIVIAKKALGVLNQDIEKAIKEKRYQEELFGTLVLDIPAKQRELEKLQSSLDQVERSLSVTLEREQSVLDAAVLKTAELTEREARVVVKESELTAKEESIRLESQKQAEERETLQKAYDAFSEALKTITWNSSKE